MKNFVFSPLDISRIHHYTVHSSLNQSVRYSLLFVFTLYIRRASSLSLCHCKLRELHFYVGVEHLVVLRSTFIFTPKVAVAVRVNLSSRGVFIGRSKFKLIPSSSTPIAIDIVILNPAKGP